jgi:hypothetical protein
VTYEELSQMYEPSDPKIASLLDLGENPNYGPGNPDWEYDRLRDDAYDLTEADLYPDEDVNRTEDE